MLTDRQARIEPPAEIIAAARQWLEPVRSALGREFLAAYLTGSVLSQGFDAKRSHINLLVVARALGNDVLDALAHAIPTGKSRPHFEPLFVTRRQMEKSVDVFPIEWLEIQERHLRLDGEDLFQTLEVPQTHLRLQCEHELRGKHIQLRQVYLASYRRPTELTRLLRSTASSFATLFRTLLRLRGETPPADTAHVIERLANLYGLDAQGLLGAHLVRYGGRRYTGEQILAICRSFLTEVDRLVNAIDELRVP
jgi:hypothetical protein